MPKAKNEKVDKARTLYRDGRKLVEIAKELDVPEGTVRRWKSVYKWDANARNKTNVRKGGAPFGNKNSVGHASSVPKGNQNARRWGMLSKYIPQDTMDLMGITAETSPIELLWDQIQIAYAAIVRAQNIAFVKDQEDITERVNASSSSDSGNSVSLFIQMPWDKQASFMKSQAIAQAELRQMIKQYDEMIHNNWDVATDIQKARLDILKGKLNEGTGQDAPLVIINDTKRDSDQ